MNKKKVLIIGGAGFIGLSITKYLLKNRDFDITIADNLFRNEGNIDTDLNDLIKNKNIKLISGDFTIDKEYNKLENDYYYVYMLASVVGVDYVNNYPDEIIRINTKLILNTLEWLKTSNCKRVLFSSTSECYAGAIQKFNYQVPTDENVPLTIDDITHPRFTYAVTKMLGESGFINYSKKHNFDCVIVRYHNVYGPRMGFKHIIPNLVERFMNNENPFQVYGYNQTRSFNYIDDAVIGTVSAIENGKSSEIYHLGSNEEITIEELVKMVGKYFDFKGKFIKSNTFSGSVSRRCPKINKANKHLNYFPKIDLKTGLDKTLKWYKNYLTNNSNSESFYNKSFPKS